MSKIELVNAWKYKGKYIEWDIENDRSVYRIWIDDRCYMFLDFDEATNFIDERSKK